MKEYNLVTENDYGTFVGRCDVLMSEGWEPQGGVSISSGDDGPNHWTDYAQAFTRSLGKRTKLKRSEL